MQTDYLFGSKISVKGALRPKTTYITLNGSTYLVQAKMLWKAKTGGTIQGNGYKLHKTHNGEYQDNGSFYKNYVYPLELKK